MVKRVIKTANSGRYRVVYLPALSRLERQFGREIPHPQSEHLTAKELEELSDLDHQRIAEARARRVAQRQKWASRSA